MNEDDETAFKQSLVGCNLGESSATEKLSQSQICVQKYHADEIVNQTIHEIHNKDIVSRAAFITELLWPVDGKFTISFLPLPEQMPQWYTMDQLKIGERSNQPLKLDPLEEKVRQMNPVDAVKLIISERIFPLVGLQISFVEKDGDVRIGFDVNGGSWSYVGQQCFSETDKSKPTINFAWLDVGTILHEFCHTMGMIHEHQNPFGQTIQWNTCRVYDWAEQTQKWSPETTFSNIIKKYNQNELNGSCFDPESIMLYFYPSDFTKNNQGTYANHVLSNEDILWLSSLYPKDRQNRVVPKRDCQSQSNTLPPSSNRYDNQNRSHILFIILGVVGVLGLFLFVLFRKNKKGNK
jgi:hypothetical protein